MNVEETGNPSPIPTGISNVLCDVSDPPAGFPMLNSIIVAVIDARIPRATDTAAGTRTGTQATVAADAAQVGDTVHHGIIIPSSGPVRGPQAVGVSSLAGSQVVLVGVAHHDLDAGVVLFFLGGAVARRIDGVLGVESLRLLLNVLCKHRQYHRSPERGVAQPYIH